MTSLMMISGNNNFVSRVRKALFPVQDSLCSHLDWCLPKKSVETKIKKYNDAKRKQVPKRKNVERKQKRRNYNDSILICSTKDDDRSILESFHCSSVKIKGDRSSTLNRSNKCRTGKRQKCTSTNTNMMQYDTLGKLNENDKPKQNCDTKKTTIVEQKKPSRRKPLVDISNMESLANSNNNRSLVKKIIHKNINGNNDTKKRALSKRNNKQIQSLDISLQSKIDRPISTRRQYHEKIIAGDCLGNLNSNCIHPNNHNITAKRKSQKAANVSKMNKTIVCHQHLV